MDQVSEEKLDLGISEEELQEREERNLERFKKKVNQYVSENDS